jgi:hypothetical protein
MTANIADRDAMTCAIGHMCNGEHGEIDASPYSDRHVATGKRAGRLSGQLEKTMARLNKKVIAALALAALSAAGITACTQDAQAMDAQQIEKQYGVSGAYPETITTTDGPLKGMLVPITLANGAPGHLFIPQRQPGDLQTVYLRDAEGLHPVRLGDNVTRAELTRSPGIVQARPEQRRANKRSWEKEALIIGGSAGAGTAIGAIAGGKKGAGVGAAAGGVGGLIYDLATRNKK